MMGWLVRRAQSIPEQQITEGSARRTRESRRARRHARERSVSVRNLAVRVQSRREVRREVKRRAGTTRTPPFWLYRTAINQCVSSSRESPWEIDMMRFISTLVIIAPSLSPRAARTPRVSLLPCDPPPSSPLLFPPPPSSPPHGGVVQPPREPRHEREERDAGEGDEPEDDELRRDPHPSSRRTLSDLENITPCTTGLTISQRRHRRRRAVHPGLDPVQARVIHRHDHVGEEHRQRDDLGVCGPSAAPSASRRSPPPLGRSRSARSARPRRTPAPPSATRA